MGDGFMRRNLTADTLAQAIISGLAGTAVTRILAEAVDLPLGSLIAIGIATGALAFALLLLLGAKRIQDETRGLGERPPPGPEPSGLEVSRKLARDRLLAPGHPALTRPFATLEELAEDYIRGRTLYALDLRKAGDGPAIFRRTLVDCVIMGPATVRSQGSTFVEPRYVDLPDPRHLDELWTEVPRGTRGYHGVLFLIKCEFRDCFFDGVGFLGTAEEIKRFLDAFPEFKAQPASQDQEPGLAQDDEENRP